MDIETFKAELTAGRRDFAGIDLSGADLSKLDLRGINLREAILRNCDFYRADLRHGADLSGAQMERASLRKALLLDARLPAATLSGVDGVAGVFVRADFQGADLGGALLMDADIRKSNLRDADLNRANVSRSVLRSADIEGVNFARATLVATNLLYATGTPRSVRGCQISSGTCELSEWDLAQIETWMSDGARLERWPLPEVPIPQTSDQGLRRRSLHDLLTRRFAAADLRDFIFYHLPALEDRAPQGNASLADIVRFIIQAADSGELPLDDFFSALKETRPNLVSEIDSVARHWLN